MTPGRGLRGGAGHATRGRLSREEDSGPSAVLSTTPTAPTWRGSTPTLPSDMQDLDRLFVYGTLMAGFSRRPLLGAAILEGAGRIRGSLYDFGEYPGVVLDDAGWVSGELYRLSDLAARLPRLDREEGYDPTDETESLYVRRRVTVHLARGVSRDAWTYVYNEPSWQSIWGPPGRGSRIGSGDWRAHVKTRDVPAR